MLTIPTFSPWKLWINLYKTAFSTFDSYCCGFRLKFYMLNFNLRLIFKNGKKNHHKLRYLSLIYKMQRLVAVTAIILWPSCHRLAKDCMGKWKVSQNNSAGTLKHKYALWTLQNNQVCGREEEWGSQLPCNPTEGCFPMGITHSTHPISSGSNPASGAPLVFGSCENRLFSGTRAVLWICFGRGSGGEGCGRDAGISFFFLKKNLAWVRFSQWPR